VITTAPSAWVTGMSVMVESFVNHWRAMQA
jgi:hypothetical protein